MVKRILHTYPDLCDWKQFRLPAEPLHCCTVSLLVQSGMWHLDKQAILLNAIAYDDEYALAAYIAERDPHPRSYMRAHFISTIWKALAQYGSAKLLNRFRLFSNPDRHLDQEDLAFLAERHIDLKDGRFQSDSTVDFRIWEGQEKYLSIELVRKWVDDSDNPHLLQQLALLFSDLFEDFTVTQRFRRPCVEETLRQLGCCTYQATTPHVCEILYDTYIE